ncbi:hypothetical protein [Fluviicola sp.]|uniref:hypothetical protein n=1 Tax=Fluviicola sp. TaxID=1917219 RepID=UPI002609E90A|nr:hypothetical protein [Fluviicola sp.]
MKMIITILLMAFCPLMYGQVLHQTLREDKTYEYWFSLDQYQKPFNYVVEIEQVGGNITKLKGIHKGHHGSGEITISDLNGNILYGEKLGKELSFEFATDQQEIIIEVLINGFTVYQKQTKINMLTVLVLKLQPEPQDAVYQINAQKELSASDLDIIMQCVNHCVQPGVNKDITTCGKKGETTISLQH